MFLQLRLNKMIDNMVSIEGIRKEEDQGKIIFYIGNEDTRRETKAFRYEVSGYSIGFFSCGG